VKHRYRIERTELHTRVYWVTAPDEETALAEYMEADQEDEEHSYHSGEPQVRVTHVARVREGVR
jgi:hypothetical protein